MSIILAIIVLILLPNMIARVPPDHEVIIERFGKFLRLLKPGIHYFFIPFVDRTARSFSTKRHTVDLPKASALSLDEVPLTVSCEFTYQIVDSMKIYEHVPDHRQSINTLAHAAIQSVIKDYTFFDAHDNRRSIENSILRRIEDGLRHWGIRAIDLKVHAMTPPEQILAAMAAKLQRKNAQ